MLLTIRVLARELSSCLSISTPRSTGCYSFKTSVRHGLFLDLAYSNEMSVLVGFRIGATYNTPLSTVADIERVKSKIRYQIRSNLHPGNKSVAKLGRIQHSSCRRNPAPSLSEGHSFYRPQSRILAGPILLSNHLMDCGERVERALALLRVR